MTLSKVNRDLQLGDQKSHELNHLVDIFLVPTLMKREKQRLFQKCCDSHHPPRKKNIKQIDEENIKTHLFQTLKCELPGEVAILGA